MFRADGWTLRELARHFEVDVRIVKAWLEGPRKKDRRKRTTPVVATRKPGYRDDSEHVQRMAAHAARIREAENVGLVSR